VIFDATASHPKINDRGIIAYGHPDGIFTIAPGEAPQLGVPNGELLEAGSPGFNNHGDLVYRRGLGSLHARLFGPGDVQLSPYTIGAFLDLNDLGDIVFTAFWSVDHVAILDLVLLTQHPEDFSYPLYDSDGDILPDWLDVCPQEDATGFDVDEDGCIDSLLGLIEIVENLVIEGEISEVMQIGLLAKADTAAQSTTEENVCAVIGQLAGFQKQVQAQSGKKISVSAVDELLNYANSVSSFYMTQSFSTSCSR